MMKVGQRMTLELQKLEEEISPELFGWICFQEETPWLSSLRSLEQDCKRFVYRETGVEGKDQERFGYHVTKVAIRKVEQ